MLIIKQCILLSPMGLKLFTPKQIKMFIEHEGLNFQAASTQPPTLHVHNLHVYSFMHIVTTFAHAKVFIRYVITVLEHKITCLQVQLQSLHSQMGNAQLCMCKTYMPIFEKSDPENSRKAQTLSLADRQECQLSIPGTRSQNECKFQTKSYIFMNIKALNIGDRGRPSWC